MKKYYKNSTNRIAMQVQRLKFESRYTYVYIQHSDNKDEW